MREWLEMGKCDVESHYFDIALKNARMEELKIKLEQKDARMEEIQIKLEQSDEVAQEAVVVFESELVGQKAFDDYDNNVLACHLDESKRIPDADGVYLPDWCLALEPRFRREFIVPVCPKTNSWPTPPKLRRKRNVTSDMELQEKRQKKLLKKKQELQEQLESVKQELRCRVCGEQLNVGEGGSVSCYSIVCVSATDLDADSCASPIFDVLDVGEEAPATPTDVSSDPGSPLSERTAL